ncbi:MAG: ATP-grasp fold amidoligase family protein [Ornithinimicrobium sp.]
MAKDLRAWVRRRLPAIAWRDELLAERSVQIALLRQQVAANTQVPQDEPGSSENKARPSAATQAPSGPNAASPASFQGHLRDLRRHTRQLALLDEGRLHPLRRIPRKLRNYRLAASHGVSIPKVLNVWAELDDVDLADMPETFVIKSDQGAGGRGVLPLRRLPEGGFQMVGGERTFSYEDVIARLSDKSVHAPFFTEEILVQPGGGALPEDIKIYMFYGEVGHVMLRKMPQHANLKQARYRFLDESGADLGQDVAPGRMIDESITPPCDLDHYVDIARHLSRAVALPFVRVDVYETTLGPVFGELTRGPGGRQAFRADHDRLLGEMWDRAQLRLDLDVVAGRPLRNLTGEHPVAKLYPVESPDAWELPDDHAQVTPLPCSSWCLASQANDGAATH